MLAQMLVMVRQIRLFPEQALTRSGCLVAEAAGHFTVRRHAVSAVHRNAAGFHTGIATAAAREMVAC